MTTTHWQHDEKAIRHKLATHNANLRRHYAEFQNLATLLKRRNIVRYSNEKHRYEDCIHAAGRLVSHKERQTVAAFLKLQTNIATQAMLILEMEQAIEREESR
jgi:hypothetical protein